MTALLRLLTRHFAHSGGGICYHGEAADQHRGKAGWCGWRWRTGWATLHDGECLTFAGPCWWLVRGCVPLMVPLTRDASVWDRSIN
jgi:hypothetical protein